MASPRLIVCLIQNGDECQTGETQSPKTKKQQKPVAESNAVAQIDDDGVDDRWRAQPVETQTHHRWEHTAAKKKRSEESDTHKNPRGVQFSQAKSMWPL